MVWEPKLGHYPEGRAFDSEIQTTVYSALLATDESVNLS
jgi:hypothetical protein